MLASFRSTVFRVKAWRRISFRRVESTTAAATPSYTAKKEGFFTPTMVLVGIMPIFTFALGTWQVQRLKWKVALIDELEEKQELEPMDLPKLVNIAAIPEFAFRKVVMEGHWDTDRAILMGPRVFNGTVGYHLVVPFIRSGGSTVLVNRGFVSKPLAEKARHFKEDGEVEVVGLLRTSQVRNYFTPDNHPEKGEWYWADVETMAEHVGGENAGVQPVFVEEIFEGHGGDVASRLAHGIPIGRAPTVDLRNAHASYAATWYSLSAFTTFMFIRLLMKRRSKARLPR